MSAAPAVPAEGRSPAWSSPAAVAAAAFVVRAIAALLSDRVVADVLSRIGDKWTVYVVRLLSDGRGLGLVAGA